ncbi:hypothetical protein SDC9_177230 [bioreactor metagenome]|uniref:Uncharacterized protein n=1 Tax=bioreactor metagenome TaxID=1076179 RepID=A0A645GS92_9ZZZZ
MKIMDREVNVDAAVFTLCYNPPNSVFLTKHYTTSQSTDYAVPRLLVTGLFYLYPGKKFTCHYQKT